MSRKRKKKKKKDEIAFIPVQYFKNKIVKYSKKESS